MAPPFAAGRRKRLTGAEKEVSGSAEDSPRSVLDISRTRFDDMANGLKQAGSELRSVKPHSVRTGKRSGPARPSPTHSTQQLDLCAEAKALGFAELLEATCGAADSTLIARVGTCDLSKETDVGRGTKQLADTFRSFRALCQHSSEITRGEGGQIETAAVPQYCSQKVSGGQGIQLESARKHGGDDRPTATTQCAALRSLESGEAIRLDLQDSSHSSNIAIAGVAGSPPSDHCLHDLVELLQEGSEEQQRQAAVMIRAAARKSIDARNLLAEAGVIGPLVALLDSDDNAALENAALAICNVSIGNSRNKALVVEAGAIRRLAALLKHEELCLQEAAVAAILTLAAEEDYKAAIGAAGCIPLITSVLNHGTPQGRSDAAHALYNLSGHESNSAKILSASPLAGLLQVLDDSPESRAAEKAVALIYTLAATEEGRSALTVAPTAVPFLLAVIQDGNERSRELGASALLTICSQSRTCCSKAIGLGAVQIFLELGQSAPARLRTKCRALLKCLDKPGSAPVVLMQSPPSPTSKSPMPPASPASPCSPEISLSAKCPSSGGSRHGVADTVGDFSFTSGNNVVKEMVEEARRGAMRQIRLRANLPEL